VEKRAGSRIKTREQSQKGLTDAQNGPLLNRTLKEKGEPELIDRKKEIEVFADWRSTRQQEPGSRFHADQKHRRGGRALQKKQTVATRGHLSLKGFQVKTLKDPERGG